MFFLCLVYVQVSYTLHAKGLTLNREKYWAGEKEREREKTEK